MERTYRLSPYVNIYPYDKGKSKVTVSNSLTGKSLELGEQVIAILAHLKKSSTVAGTAAAFSLGEETVEKLLVELSDHKLIVDETLERDFTVEITRTTQKAFGIFNQYSVNGNDSTRDKFCLIGVPYARGNDVSVGSAHFPNHLRMKTAHLELNSAAVDYVNFDFLGAGRNYSKLNSRLQKAQIVDEGNLFLEMNETQEFSYAKMEKIAARYFRNGRFPFFIGGDHSISYPLIKAAADCFNEIQVVHLDAHSDTSYSRIDKIRGADHISHTHANFASRCLQLEGVLELHQFGLRGMSNRSFSDSPKQKIYWIDDVRRMVELQNVVKIDQNIPVYLTIDIDILDPSVAPGTGSPVPDGLSIRELTEFLNLLLPGLNVIAMDLVEVDPSLDTRGITTQNAASIILHVLNLV